jgi:hypothetical protein
MRIFAYLLLALAVALGGCKSPAKADKAKKAALTKTKANLREDSDVDFQAFIGRLRKAVEAHDVNALAQMMTSDFGYSLRPEKSGEGVFKYWDDQNLWPELNGILTEKFVQKKNPDGKLFMVAPPQFADESLNYDGYRAGITRVNGSWKFTYFVNG